MFVALEVLIAGFFIGSTIFFIKNYINNEIEKISMLNCIHHELLEMRLQKGFPFPTGKKDTTGNGVILKGRGIARPFEPGEIKKVYSMIDKGVSPKEIAKRLNRSLSSIFLYKRKWKSKQDTSN
jgi:hypothetical protein